MMLDEVKWTPIETRILSYLKDGQRHRTVRLRKDCIDDEEATNAELTAHVGRIRKKLPPGLEIVCIYYQKAYYYRLIRPVTFTD